VKTTLKALLVAIALSIVTLGCTLTAFAVEPPESVEDLVGAEAEYKDFRGSSQSEVRIPVSGFIVRNGTGSTNPPGTNPPGTTNPPLGPGTNPPPNTGDGNPPEGTIDNETPQGGNGSGSNSQTGNGSGQDGNTINNAPESPSYTPRENDFDNSKTPFAWPKLSDALKSWEIYVIFGLVLLIGFLLWFLLKRRKDDEEEEDNEAAAEAIVETKAEAKADANANVEKGSL